MRLSRIGFILLLVLSLGFAEPKTENSISFQGFLTDSNSEPYMGTVKIGFKFYPNAASTTPLLPSFSVDSNPRNIRLVTVFNGNYTTKIEFNDTEIAILNAESNVWVEVYVASKNTETKDVMSDDNKLTPRIQLNAVPYALAVRGVYYDALNDIVKIGQGYQAASVNVSTTNGIANNDARRGGMMIQGQVGIGTATPAAKNALHVIGNVEVTGNVFVEKGTVSAKKVFGAVWN